MPTPIAAPDEPKLNLGSPSFLPFQSDDSEVKSVTVNQKQHHLSDLREYTEYTFWVSAFNANGEGAFSAEVVARTHSDVPADPPVNVTVEAASSRSLIVRWEPPPKESQNGIITGYKLRSVEGTKAAPMYVFLS